MHEMFKMQCFSPFRAHVVPECLHHRKEIARKNAIEKQEEIGKEMNSGGKGGFH